MIGSRLPPGLGKRLKKSLAMTPAAVIALQQGSIVHAREGVGGGKVAPIHQAEKRENSLPVLKADENKEPGNVVLDGKIIDWAKISKPSNAAQAPSTDDLKEKICSKGGSDGVCSFWDGNGKSAKKAFETAAKVAGIPVQLLMCITQQESSFGRNKATSSAGAGGLTHFMPDTAAQFEKRAKSVPLIKDLYEHYKEKMSKETPPITVHPFTKDIILSKDFDDHYSTQIFATAIYLRDQLAGQGEKEFLGKGENAANMKNIVKWLAASYNGGAGGAKKLEAAGFNEDGIESCKERTQLVNYIKDVSDCTEGKIERRPAK